MKKGRLCAWDLNLGRQDGRADESTELWQQIFKRKDENKQ